MASVMVFPSFFGGEYRLLSQYHLELGTIRSMANLANWENEKSHGQNFGKRRFSKSLLLLVSTLTGKKKKKKKKNLA